MSFPQTRMRRLRISPGIRKMLAGVQVTVDDLIYPLFVREGQGGRQEIQAIPGVFQYTLDDLLYAAEEAAEAGIPAVLLFGIPADKDAAGSQAYAEDGIIQRSVGLLKKEFPDLVAITDVCLCEYTDHGHCGIVRDGRILNDPTLELLAKTAVSHAQVGADIVAPSGMMDGRVDCIRQALDKTGYNDTLIMSYAAKFASSFYGPFREAACSAPAFGDRCTYQMDPKAGVDQAMQEIALNIEEGADIVIVKPALVYLDIIRAAREQFRCPLVAYNVSGEYAMLKAAAQMGWIQEKQVVGEVMTGLKRAGSDLIITYSALDIARWIKESEEE
ncbi:MAG: porphobilinogen synthase [Desulfitobacteriaceae bacterium]|nr:porphobilinogen synthase [Desulfitobacteriaceae bacterium]MDD4400624.1 porphobilinogen synthase [Desulfitobacteriaceae bacterium]